MESEVQSVHKFLVDRSRDGDRQAQNELYRLHVKAMYNICRRMMGDEDEAKDVLQEAFIEAFTKLDSLKHAITFPAWLKRIVVNKCINQLRKNKNITSSLEETGEVMDMIEEEVTSGDQLFVKASAARIMRAVDMISEGCRTVFNLYLFDGYDHKEIGQILSISESASKAQYSKAKSKIRKLLESNTV